MTNNPGVIAQPTRAAQFGDNMKIWKWTLELAEVQTIEIHHGARLLSVQMQNGMPQLWALVDELAYKDRRTIALYGTGSQIHGNPGEYIGTFQMADGYLVLHAFDVND